MLTRTNMVLFCCRNYEGRKQFASRLEAESTADDGGYDVASTGYDVTAASTGWTEAAAGLRRIEEETEYDDSDEDEEAGLKFSAIKAVAKMTSPAAKMSAPATPYRQEDDHHHHQEVSSLCSSASFPVLAPPEQFQNCISPSAMYEDDHFTTPGRTFALLAPSYHHGAGDGGLMNSKAGMLRAGVASPAYSQDSTSTGTEKSVRFSDRDHILSTPEPRPPPPGGYSLEVGGNHEGGEVVKGILKAEATVKVPDVTSFILDSEDGTLV